jgi:hypothetical protein
MIGHGRYRMNGGEIPADRAPIDDRRRQTFQVGLSKSTIPPIHVFRVKPGPFGVAVSRRRKKPGCGVLFRRE